MVSKYLAAAALAMVATTPVMAQSASKLSLSNARLGTPTSESSKLAGGASGIIGALAIVVGGIIIVASSDDEDYEPPVAPPVSP